MGAVCCAGRGADLPRPVVHERAGRKLLSGQDLRHADGRAPSGGYQRPDPDQQYPFAAADVAVPAGHRRAGWRVPGKPGSGSAAADLRGACRVALAAADHRGMGGAGRRPAVPAVYPAEPDGAVLQQYGAVFHSAVFCLRRASCPPCRVLARFWSRGLLCAGRRGLSAAGGHRTGGSGAGLADRTLLPIAGSGRSVCRRGCARGGGAGLAHRPAGPGRPA